MKINVELNSKSIKDAVRILKNQKKVLLDQMIPEYMELAADWIINRANEILDKSDIGENVKSYIFRAWDTKWIGKYHLQIINHSRKSTYVEFGVGIVGQTSEHPNAQTTNWEYNLDTIHKDVNGAWRFTVYEEDDLDISKNAIIEQFDEKNKTAIYTMGTQGVWYLYNAVEDFKVRYQQQLWEKIKKKYWS